MSDEIPLFPVAEMTVGPVPSMGVIVIRPDFLTHAMQPPEQSHPGRTYVLTREQALHLMQKIHTALAMLETSAPPDGGSPRH